MARARRPVRDRLLSGHRKVAGCWLWSGAVHHDGYGVLTVGRRQKRAHRAAFEEFHGAIPDGGVICHKCDTPLCINPAHLFLGTPADNAADREKKGRGVRRSGLEHVRTKISPAQREEIRRLRGQGNTLASIAERYSITFQTVSDICNRRRNYAAA